MFPNVETFVAQFAAVGIVVGSYLLAQYVRVWRPRRRGLEAGRIAEEPPAAPAGARSAEPRRVPVIGTLS